MCVCVANKATKRKINFSMIGCFIYFILKFGDYQIIICHTTVICLEFRNFPIFGAARQPLRVFCIRPAEVQIKKDRHVDFTPVFADNAFVLEIQYPA